MKIKWARNRENSQMITILELTELELKAISGNPIERPARLRTIKRKLSMFCNENKKYMKQP